MSGARGGAAIGTAAAFCAAAAMSLATAGLANASSPPNVNGQTYSDASTALSNAGFTPVVSTTVGDQKSWPDCLVINVVGRSVPPPENSSGVVDEPGPRLAQLLLRRGVGEGIGVFGSQPRGEGDRRSGQAEGR